MEPVFDEGFELVLVTGYPEEIVDTATDKFRPEFLEAVAADVQRELGTADVNTNPVGYGYGADTLALAVLLSGATTLLLAGKSINENIDAWLAIGRRLRNLVSTLSKRVVPPRISEPAAFAIALDAIAAKEPDLPPVVLLSKATTRVRNGSLTPAAQARFTDHPDRYYVFTVQVGERSTHVVAVSSQSDLLFHHVLPLGFAEFFRLAK